MMHHGQTMLTWTLPVPRSGVCERVTGTEVVVSADAVLWNVPYLLPAAAAPTVRQWKCSHHLLGEEGT